MAAPAKPENFDITNITGTTCLLSWDNVANESGYKIEKSLDGDSWVQIAVVEADVTQVIIRELVPLTQYFFRVRAYNGDGDSAYACIKEESSYRDDFDDASIGEEWTTFQTDVNKTIVEAAGVLTTAIVNGTNAIWFGYGGSAANLGPRIYKPLNVIPPHEIEIITKLNSSLYNAGEFVGMFIATTPEGMASGDAYLFGLIDCPSYGNNYVVMNVGSPNALAYTEGPYYAVPQWLKIKIDSSKVITFWRSENGADWTQMTAGGTPYSLSSYYTDCCVLSTETKVGLFASNNRDQWETDQAVSAPFEYFSIDGEKIASITTLARGYEGDGGDGGGSGFSGITTRLIYKNRWRD